MKKRKCICMLDEMQPVAGCPVHNCKNGYGGHDFCVINTNTGKITCCNCGKEKIKKWDKEFEDGLYGRHIQSDISLRNINIYSLFRKYNLINQYGYNLKVKIKCKDGCIQIERIK